MPGGYEGICKKMVGAEGVEPSSQETMDFKSTAYANSATPPCQAHENNSIAREPERDRMHISSTPGRPKTAS